MGNQLKHVISVLAFVSSASLFMLKVAPKEISLLCCCEIGIVSITLYLCRVFFQWLQTSLVVTGKQGKVIYTGAHSTNSVEYP